MDASLSEHLPLGTLVKTWEEAQERIRTCLLYTSFFIFVLIYYMYVVADNGVFCGFMSSCNRSGGLLQVCYRWGESVDLKFCLW